MINSHFAHYRRGFLATTVLLLPVHVDYFPTLVVVIRLLLMGAVGETARLSARKMWAVMCFVRHPAHVVRQKEMLGSSALPAVY